MHDAAAEASFAAGVSDVLDLWVAGGDGVEQRAGFTLTQRMHRHARGLVSRQPARPDGELNQRQLGLRDHTARVGGDADPVVFR